MKAYIYNLATDKYRGFIPGVVKLFLFILAIIYGLVVRIIIFVSNKLRYKPNCKVISVGNITLGGTGKTTLVEFLANFLRGQGRSLAVISRGYKRKISTLAKGYEGMGDEPYMLSKRLNGVPVIVGADRKKGIKEVIKDYAVDTVILDDAFQQWRIRKDLEIVTIDSVNPFGNYRMIPRGILREPLSSLKRADIFILTKTNLSANTANLKATLSELNPQALIFESEHKPLFFYDIDKPNVLSATESLRGKTVTLFSGIGDPESFEKLVSILGIKIGLSLHFPDHYPYANKDLEKIVRDSQDKNIDTIITTEKDAARLDSLEFKELGARILVLRIQLTIIDEQGLFSRLLKLYSL